MTDASQPKGPQTAAGSLLPAVGAGQPGKPAGPSSPAIGVSRPKRATEPLSPATEAGAGESRGRQAAAELQSPPAAAAETGTQPSVGELLARPDVVEFVAHHANTLASPRAFEGEPLPEGLTPTSAFDLVEFVRRTGAGMPVCGRHRSCGHEGSWYAMTPGFSAASPTSSTARGPRVRCSSSSTPIGWPRGSTRPASRSSNAPLRSTG